MLRNFNIRIFAEFSVIFSILTALVLTGCLSGAGTTSPAATYNISGIVSGGATGVQILLTGASSVATTTDSSGNFSFNKLNIGSYSVVPYVSGFTFTPISTAVTLSNANVPATNFIASAYTGPTYLLSGTVDTLIGVTLTLSGGASGTFNSYAGLYSFANLPTGSYTVIPSLSGYTFSPASATASVSSTNVTLPNFAATSTGGGSSTPGFTNCSTTLSVSCFNTTAVGNSWTWVGNDFCVANGAISIPAASNTRTNFSVSNGVVTQTSTAPSSCNPNAITSNRYIDQVTGDLMNLASNNGQLTTVLPATLTVGTSWTRTTATANVSAVPATIAAVNLTRIVPAGTFTNCMQVVVGPYISYNTTVTTNQYWCPTVGYYVETATTWITSSTQPGGVNTYNTNTKLQSGFIAN